MSVSGQYIKIPKAQQHPELAKTRYYVDKYWQNRRRFLFFSPSGQLDFAGERTLRIIDLGKWFVPTQPELNLVRVR